MATPVTVVGSPVLAAEQERSALDRLVALLERERPGQACLVGADHTETSIPESLYRVLLDAVRQLSHGNGVAVLPVAAELTLQQAAELLNVMPAYLVTLLDSGEMPFQQVGDHRRVTLRDVLAYKARRDQQSEDALRDLAALGQEHGLYFE